jgi:hypothetical protein
VGRRPDPRATPDRVSHLPETEGVIPGPNAQRPDGVRSAVPASPSTIVSSYEPATSQLSIGRSSPERLARFVKRERGRQRHAPHIYLAFKGRPEVRVTGDAAQSTHLDLRFPEPCQRRIGAAEPRWRRGLGRKRSRIRGSGRDKAVYPVRAGFRLTPADRS